MKIYKFSASEDCEFVAPVREDLAFLDMVQTIDGTPRGASWSPTPVKLVKVERGKRLRESDMPWMGANFAVLKPAAVPVFRDLMSEGDELLALPCEEVDLKLLNVCRVIDALDWVRSDVNRYPESGQVSTIVKYVFRPECLRGARLFKVRGKRRSPVFMSEEVVNRVRDAGLRGVGFTLLWEEERSSV